MISCFSAFFVILKFFAMASTANQSPPHSKKPQADKTTSLQSFNGSHGSFLFDLQGRKVTSPQKGIYVKDGRKLLIK